MISENIKPTLKNGLERLFHSVPKDYDFFGSYLKGVLLHDNGEVQLTYTLHEEKKTWLFAFHLRNCRDIDGISIPLNKKITTRLSLWVDEDTGVFHFEDETNAISLECGNFCVSTNEILSKEFGERFSKKKLQEYSEKLQRKFKELKNLKLPSGKLLIGPDNTYSGIKAENHRMYKLADLQRDENITYEFLIEMKKSDPCLGIYYGCKGIVKNGDIGKQIEEMDADWKAIKEKVVRRLNYTFADKVFDHRFKPTDNANDNTYWPFWITLYEDENILDVATRALIIIRDEYKQHIEGAEKYEKDETCNYTICHKENKHAKETKSQLRYDKGCYERLLHPWGGEDACYNEIWARLLKRFIKRATKLEYITRDQDYEAAWRVNCSNRTFCYLMYRLVKELDNKPIPVVSPPWECLSKVFYTNKGKSFEPNRMIHECGVERENVKDPDKKTKSLEIYNQIKNW